MSSSEWSGPEWRYPRGMSLSEYRKYKECYSKKMYLELKNARKAAYHSGAKKIYRCSVCGNFHLSTGDTSLPCPKENV